MSEYAIQAENLGKLYHLGQTVGYKTLRESLTTAAAAPFRYFRSLSHKSPGVDTSNTIWALKDVSFKVKHGEAIGIIGRNGSGKSTLLKILSRITTPTEGYANIHGRIASLLEVGTGFHPELTGRENIYLNGAVLGMKKAEIARKFDEIVAFAEIDKFLDTPVKRYSSGMYVRLAFAVAAHLDPEIFVIDEVLAVGDAQFQQKCLGKMGDIARGGRTVLFVSHNLGSVVNLCSRAILLSKGQKLIDGQSGEVVSKYIAMGSENQGEMIWNNLSVAPGNAKMRLHAVRIVSDGVVTSNVDIQKDIQIEIEFWNLKPGTRICTSIHLLDKMGIGVLASANIHSANLISDDWVDKPHPEGLYCTTCTIPGNFLNEGRYSINAIVLTDISNIEIFAREVVSFTVYETGAMRKEYAGGWLGVIRPKLAWQTEFRRPTGVGDGGAQ